MGPCLGGGINPLTAKDPGAVYEDITHLLPIAMAILSLHPAPAAAAVGQQLDIWTWRIPSLAGNLFFCLNRHQLAPWIPQNQINQPRP
jgi:hypothetical protein